jgi:glycosyltransferase involved in cell wall biosynthesis
MTDLPVSVVIVSRGRPRSLMRTLMGISQIQYWNFEVVVVADPEGIKSAAAMPFADDLKLVPFDTPNISEARNLGLSHAAGMSGAATEFRFNGRPPVLTAKACLTRCHWIRKKRRS